MQDKMMTIDANKGPEWSDPHMHEDFYNVLSHCSDIP